MELEKSVGLLVNLITKINDLFDMNVQLMAVP